MALIVEWTEEAQRQLDGVIEYLEQNWTDREINNFFKKLERDLVIISKKPETFRLSQRLPGSRECQITSHTTVFYVFDHQILTVLLLWSNKMSPSKLKGKGTIDQ